MVKYSHSPIQTSQSDPDTLLVTNTHLLFHGTVWFFFTRKMQKFLTNYVLHLFEFWSFWFWIFKLYFPACFFTPQYPFNTLLILSSMYYFTYCGSDMVNCITESRSVTQFQPQGKIMCDHNSRFLASCIISCPSLMVLKIWR